MKQPPSVLSPPLGRTHIKVNVLAALFLCTCLATLIVSTFIVKPYRATLEVTIGTAHGSPVFAYFSSKPAGYASDHFSQSLEIPIEVSPGSRTVLHRIELSSFKPLYFVRLDPAVKAGYIQLLGMRLETEEGVAKFSPEEILEMASKGKQITDVQINNGVVGFNATGGDPNFDISIPNLLVSPKPSKQIQRAIRIWLLISLPLIAAIVLLYKNDLPLLDEDNLTVSSWKKGIKSRNFSNFWIEWIAMAALTWTAFNFIELHSGIRIEPLTNIFAKDGVGDSVPNEVKAMKSIISRQGLNTYALAGDLGRGEEYNEIYQRATEYLFPALIDNTSELIFTRINLKDSYERRLCRQLDSQQDILLYDCKN